MKVSVAPLQKGFFVFIVDGMGRFRIILGKDLRVAGWREIKRVIS
jgi:hypothetical protein